MTKEQQYNEYLRWGGTMTIEEWEQDGRFDAWAAVDMSYNPMDEYEPWHDVKFATVTELKFTA